MSWRWLLPAITIGCAHPPNADPSTAGKAQREKGETAVGAYLVNPEPYLVGSLASCSLSGPVSKDLLVTAPGSIEAACEHGVSMHWSAVRATAMQIYEPRAVRLPSSGLSYIYSVSFVAEGRLIGGSWGVEWTTAPDCEDRVDLHRFNTATFVLPRRAGSCTLLARGPFDLRAAHTIVVE